MPGTPIDEVRDPVAGVGLTQVRWLLIGMQGVIALGFLWADDPEHQPLGLLAVCAALALVDAGRLAGFVLSPLAHATVDLLALGLLSILWGPHHPLQPLALVEMTIVATVLPSVRAWSITALAVGLQLLDAGLQLGDEDALHLISHASIGAVAAITLTWFAQAVGTALATRENARIAAEANKDRAARLAVVGTLAAGVAHELATPLGSITLLAEEVDAELGAPHPALAELQRQVRRCRTILDRLLQRADGPLVPCAHFGQQVERWVADWRAAQSEARVDLELEPQTQARSVQGEGQVWRAALWTLLDNAQRAGGPIQVQVGLEGTAVQIQVLDRGPGLSSVTTKRAGEPFYSAWSTPGRGLGLYALRTAIDPVGGRFTLENRAGGGARAVLDAPLLEAP